jgi:hypothetical protein
VWDGASDMSFTADEVKKLKALVKEKVEVTTKIDDTLTVTCDHELSNDEKKSYREGCKIWY